jgi:hypothetical protein
MKWKIAICTLLAAIRVVLADYTVTQSDFNTYAGRHNDLIQSLVNANHVNIYMPSFASAYQFTNAVKLKSGCRINLGSGAQVYAMPYGFTNLNFVGIFMITNGMTDVKILGVATNKALLKYDNFYAYQAGGTNKYIAGNPNKSGILVYGGRDVEIANIRFEYCAGDGVTVEEKTTAGEITSNITVRAIETYRCARSGVVITGGDTVNLLDSVLEESSQGNQTNQFRYEQGEGVHIEAYYPPLYGVLVSNVTTIGCTRGLKVAMYSTNIYIRAHSTSDVRIKNCTFRDSEDYGLMFRNCYDGVPKGFIEARFCVMSNNAVGGIRFQNWGTNVQVKLVQETIYNAPGAIMEPVSIDYYGGDPTLQTYTLSSIGNIYLHSIHVWQNDNDNVLSCTGDASAGVLIDNVWGGIWTHGTTTNILQIAATNINVTVTP